MIIWSNARDDTEDTSLCYETYDVILWYHGYHTWISLHVIEQNQPLMGKLVHHLVLAMLADLALSCCPRQQASFLKYHVVCTYMKLTWIYIYTYTYVCVNNMYIYIYTYIGYEDKQIYLYETKEISTCPGNQYIHEISTCPGNQGKIYICPLLKTHNFC